MLRIATLILAIVAVPASAQQPKDGNVKTVVDGTTFLVRVRGADVYVADKAMLVVQTMDLRDKMRIAVKQATGCEITDEIWLKTKLGGKLSCPS